ARQPDAAGGGLDEAGHETQQRRLPGAVRAQQGDAPAVGNREAHTEQDLQRAVRVVDALDLKQWSCRRHRPPSSMSGVTLASAAPMGEVSLSRRKGKKGRRRRWLSPGWARPIWVHGGGASAGTWGA